ncbi:TraR/DksA family transcriptional regulator [Acidovorax sp. 106]|uniref:TraR/DksA family transcriptional regulator n=1 Tax=Acidovorax sp. 106 TaxID=2135637 RepID=UPI000EB1ED3E|nr:TraR/DksA family transcriptional regulator [Acidovorax sp. 106]RLJ37365.1 TraR/DksA family transcriptional regulator [Acidovorax sp. 106]
MDKTQAASYRQQLQEQQAGLRAQLAQQRGEATGRVEAAAAHFAHAEDSRAQVASERTLEFALEDRETEHLNAIAAALTRIDAGTYGECTDCSQDIATARLKATPEVARCVHCQESIETHHRPAH